MVIDNNEKEKQAMAAFSRGDKTLGHELQDSFLTDIKESGEDHCSCPASCKHHGDCFACVVIHRGHRDHLPVCFHDMVNERLLKASELTEHSICDKTK